MPVPRWKAGNAHLSDSVSGLPLTPVSSLHRNVLIHPLIASKSQLYAIVAFEMFIFDASFYGRSIAREVP